MDDPQRAADFYGSVFGWDIVRSEGPIDYWLASTGPLGELGINGAIMARGDMSRGTYNTVGVASLDESIQKVQAAGGRVLMSPDLIPGIGRFAYCADPEGNVFGVLQPEEMPAPPAS